MDGSAPVADGKEAVIAGIFSLQPAVDGRDRLERGAGRVAYAPVAVSRRQKPRDAQALRERATLARRQESFKKMSKTLAAHRVLKGEFEDEQRTFFVKMAWLFPAYLFFLMRTNFRSHESLLVKRGASL